MNRPASVWDPKLYQEKHSFVYEYGKSLVEFLNPQVGERILDLGCGSGDLTMEIGKHALEVVGIDNSPEMIASAKLNFPGVEFQLGDASDFHFHKKFDSIFSNATLHWVTDYRSAISCMHSNLKKGGKIVVEFGGAGNVKAITDQLRKSLYHRGYREQSNLDLWYFPSIGAYTSELEAIGFNVVFAQLYDRPTELSDEESGIKDWISMFGTSFFEGVRTHDVADILSEVQESLKPVLFKEGTWYADYKRLRVIAYKS